MKLSDTHLVLLSAAAQRDDHALELPPDLEPAAAEKLVAKLAGAGLIEETEATGTLPVWRRVDDAAFALRITVAGLKAIGIDEGAGSLSDKEISTAEPTQSAVLDQDAPASGKPKTSGSRRKAVKAASSKSKRRSARAESGPPAPSRRGTKLDQVKGLLARKRGATIGEMMQATDWQPHTTRAVLTGFRKRGIRIEREAIKDKPAVYRIVGGGEAKARTVKPTQKAA